VKVLLSVAKLTEVLRGPFTRQIDRREIGAQESNRWLDGAHQMIAAGDDAGSPEPIHHVHYKSLVADPLGTVSNLYRHFGLTLEPEEEASIARYVRERPNGGYGPRLYRFEDHGLDSGLEREKFRGYMRHFGIEAETDAETDAERRPSGPKGPRATAARPPAQPLRPVTT
jgi:hypothetical protein